MRLRGRFTLGFAAAALIPIVATGVVAWHEISAGYRDEFAAKLRASREDAQRELDRVRGGLVQAVDATQENPLIRATLVDLRKSGELAYGERQELRAGAAAMMHSLGLQLMTLTAADDTVLAAPHFDAHVDEKDPEPARLAHKHAGVPAVAWAKVLRDGKVKTILVVQAARRVADGGQSVSVLLGRELGDELLAPLRHEGIDARLVDAKGNVIAPAGDPGRTSPSPDQDLVLEDEDGHTVAHVIVSVSDAALVRRLHDLALYTAALGLAALVAAAFVGFLVARRMTRHLDALVEGVGAVGRGDLDARVTLATRDEVGDLARAFNAMTGELADAKDRAIQAERIAAWQDIARSLAHELKNPLTPIQMSVETMRKTHALGHPDFGEIFDESTRTVLEEVQRLKKIIGEFSQFARLPAPQKGPLDVNDLVGGALALYRGAVRVVSQLGESLPRVDADRDQITQVVLNLLENARDAVASKGSDETVGRITVTTRSRASAVELEVADNGPGFDPTLRDKLFTPYFTTKDTGTGLGLAIVRRIVTDHGGRVTAHSEPGKGARFVVELPTARG
jgi:signal transduction histidine kinase